MIFSQWQPDGGFAYYESALRHPIGDDVPEIRYPKETVLGVPAQDVGFPLPSDAELVGYGSMPKGIMAPMARGKSKGLGEVKTKLSQDDMIVVLFLIGVLGAAAWASRKG